MPASRRQFIQSSAAVAAGLAASASSTPSQAEPAATPAAPFRSQWQQTCERVWLGPEYWANPLQDWRVADGRIECHHAAPDRNVHLLTRQLASHAGDVEMSMRVGRIGGGAVGEGQGSAGFRIGIRGPLEDYRNALIFGAGIDAGLTSAGALFIGKIEDAKPGKIALDGNVVELRLCAKPQAGSYVVTLSALDEKGTALGEAQDEFAADELVGGVALVANFGRPAPRNNRQGAKKNMTGAGRWTFADWTVSGTKFEEHEDRAFGPILFSHYTLSQGTLKLTAQMPPIGEKDSQVVRLSFLQTNAPMLEATIHPQARTATFRVDDWKHDTDQQYRLTYGAHQWDGVIRRDPVDKPELVVGDVSCNTHAAFPNAQFVANMASLDPDLLAFVGDQFYENSGGYGTVRDALQPAILDYLRKWYLHGWTWRELTKDRPSVSLPDDHDVYQGNIWGEAGEAKHGTQEMGGYDMPAEWVNVVYRTQTSHHPDPYDPTPMKQGILVFYGPMTYGGVSFAIIADRMFKSGPEGKVPPTGNRGDHVVDPNFDPKTADVPGLQLLGERQMNFLRAWAAEDNGGAMKAVISQTIFAAMATTHGANRERLVADYDANGWPQTPRNEALRLIQQARAFHIAGDQHLPAVIQYGIDEFRDGPVAFAGPAVNVGYPRWFEPASPGENRKPGAPENTGDFLDHFGNRMTVMAVADGAIEPRKGVIESLEDRASGLGIVRFDKTYRRVVIECWPLTANPMMPGTQFPGWPVIVEMSTV
ncbi:MAG TPA: alkaline phosphatase D family protein [Pirellulales bacterium]|nr:alkaline phosphatase D family protein [Pirellulales bacterium]